MESIRIPYKNDIYGNAIYARVSWSKEGSQIPKPIGTLRNLSVFGTHL